MKELTEEELEEKRRKNRERVTRYRVKHGILSTGRGQTKRGERVTSEIKNGVLIHTRERDEWRPEPQTHLTKDSKLEDLLPWAMEVADAEKPETIEQVQWQIHVGNLNYVDVLYCSQEDGSYKLVRYGRGIDYMDAFTLREQEFREYLTILENKINSEIVEVNI